MDAAAVSKGGVELRPVVEEQVSGGSPGIGRAVRDDGQDVLDDLLLQAHEALQDLAVVRCKVKLDVWP